MDFDDLLVCAVRLLAEHPHHLELYRRRWPWILVDEYQDTCQAQAVLVSLLAGRDGNSGRRRRRRPGACTRSAAPTRAGWPGSPSGSRPRADRARAQLPLPRRDPVGGRPVDPAQPRPGAQDADRDARARRTGAGGRVLLRARGGLLDRGDRGPGACRRGTPPTEILLLARTGYANGPVQTALAAAGIPHRVLGSLGLYERSEVRDALAYLTLIVNPADAQAFRRAVGAPRRGVGERTAGQMVALRPRAPRRRPDRRQRQRDAERDRHRKGARAARAVRPRARAGPRRARRRDARSGT